MVIKREVLLGNKVFIQCNSTIREWIQGSKKSLRRCPHWDLQRSTNPTRRIDFYVPEEPLHSTRDCTKQDGYLGGLSHSLDGSHCSASASRGVGFNFKSPFDVGNVLRKLSDNPRLFAGHKIGVIVSVVLPQLYGHKRFNFPKSHTRT